MPHACHSRFWKCYKTLHVVLTFGKVQNALPLPRKTTSEPSKVVRACGALNIWLGNVLRATTTCTFSTSQLPLVVRSSCVLHMLTLKCPRATKTCTFSTSQLPKVVSDLNLLHFWLRNLLCATTACNFSSLISPDGSPPAALASLLFDPPEPQIIGKTQCVATFLPFRAPASSFLWLFLFSDLLSSASSLLWLFPPLLFVHVWLLNFLRWGFFDGFLVVNDD